ncbi:AAA family ATPase [Metabacillus idriensis]|uniref:AAA family ATPase n=1 Tax=Metabacillus idriensis TaxID=324768 RepID=UPI00203B92C2|nr:AAA family ATPase [Metabacillus idriensis]MCM3598670.1 AAA family ATPase [Metabacillus idriensis]
MKTIKLLQLTLKNFKGVKNFTFDAQGENVKVYGDNATGKTTLFDGFIWLLFDKDSQNKKDFQIKTLSNSGDNYRGLDHEVEGSFLINDKKLTLRKVFSEKWTKKRGAAQAEFSGHSTDYFIDSVPAKKKDFVDKVAGIVDEDIFKLLTSPSYFNEQLHWQKRREILLEVCGGITDQEVIESNKKLVKLPAILRDRSIEDHRKVIAAKRAEINKELDRIPIRIDEVQRTIPDVADLDQESLNDEITFLKREIEEKEKEISRIQTGGEVANKEKQLREIESDLINLKNEFQSASHVKVNEQRRHLFELQSELDTLNHEVKRKERQILSNKDIALNHSNETARLREDWHAVNNRQFENDHSKDCPTCGQALPDEQIQAAHDKAMASFNLRKSKELEEISHKGKVNTQRVKDIEEKNAHLQSEINELLETTASKQAEVNNVEELISSLQKEVKDIGSDPVYTAKKAQALKIEAEIQELKSSVNQALTKTRDELSRLKVELNSLQQEISKFNLVKQSESRIEELEAQEKELAGQFEDLEQELYLTEEFIRTKVNLLEDKINSKFKYARFNLFKTNINGGLEEICDTTYKGVPYSTGLNNAARINIGLDIINTLSDHYGVSAPIFVDNSEAVTQLIDVKSQVVSLVVSEADKELRVEYGKHLDKEAI